MGNKALDTANENNVYYVIGNRIKARRLELNISQQTVANWISISAQTLCNIEGGNTKMQLDTLLRVCKALKISAGSVLPHYDEYDIRDWKCSPKRNEDALCIRRRELMEHIEECDLIEVEILFAVLGTFLRHKRSLKDNSKR